MAKRKKDPQIIEIMDGNAERERKFIPRVPDEIREQGEDAVAEYKKARLNAIYRHVCESPDEFVTADHPDHAPALPPGVNEKFDTPAERTAPRERLYFVDAALQVWKHKLEIRQEIRGYGVKQTVKIGNGATASKPTLDRMELQSKLGWVGANLDAVDDKAINKGDGKWLRRTFGNSDLKPAFRLVSQRLKVSYHPEGNQNVTIEVACDIVLVGETMFGDVWRDPKLEIEIKEPKDLSAAEAARILDREERRFMEKFDLERQLESNAVMGYERLKDKLLKPEGQLRFKNLKAEEPWWTAEGRRRLFGEQAPAAGRFLAKVASFL